MKHPEIRSSYYLHFKKNITSLTNIKKQKKMELSKEGTDFKRFFFLTTTIKETQRCYIKKGVFSNLHALY
jgi:hypothetical protein